MNTRNTTSQKDKEDRDKPDLNAVLSAGHKALTLDQYQDLARLTDHKTPESLDFPLLGLFGEVGSLLSELKKKQRDADSYVGYESSVVEELGDVLWYFANVTTRTNIRLSGLISQKGNVHARRSTASRDNGAIQFTALQPRLAKGNLKADAAFEATLIRLAGLVGNLLAEFSAQRINSDSVELTAHMGSIFAELIRAANEADVSLAEAAYKNVQKIFDRWPLERIYPPLLDADYESAEQLPRQIRMEILERTVNKKVYVFLRCNDINIGDRLTDNKLEKDDYRFHDVFHLAYAAKLGWSPVMRALFRVKRKSRPQIDESEDGARAILIEEGVATWIFNHAAPLNFYENLSTVDYGLLKAVRELVRGYEVDRMPLWLWEEAILDGYEVFRQLRKHRRGIVTANLEQRTITFEVLPK